MSDDLISRKDAIDAVIAYLDLCCMTEARFHEGGKSYNRQIAEEIFEEILTGESKQGGWIPCSERLPEEHEWIGTKTFGTTISDEVCITFDKNGKRFVRVMSLQNRELSSSDKQSMDVFHKGWKMLAWMPLPEPWEGADDDTTSVLTAARI